MAAVWPKVDVVGQGRGDLPGHLPHGSCSVWLGICPSACVFQKRGPGKFLA